MHPLRMLTWYPHVKFLKLEKYCTKVKEHVKTDEFFLTLDIV